MLYEAEFYDPRHVYIDKCSSLNIFGYGIPQLKLSRIYEAAPVQSEMLRNFK